MTYWGKAPFQGLINKHTKKIISCMHSSVHKTRVWYIKIQLGKAHPTLTDWKNISGFRIFETSFNICCAVDAKRAPITLKNTRVVSAAQLERIQMQQGFYRSAYPLSVKQSFNGTHYLGQ